MEEAHFSDWSVSDSSLWAALSVGVELEVDGLLACPKHGKF
jgi:hypothetical protein